MTQQKMNMMAQQQMGAMTNQQLYYQQAMANIYEPLLGNYRAAGCPDARHAYKRGAVYCCRCGLRLPKRGIVERFFRSFRR